MVSVPDRGNSGYQACEAGASLLLNGAAIGQVLLSSANFYWYYHLPYDNSVFPPLFPFSKLLWNLCSYWVAVRSSIFHWRLKMSSITSTLFFLNYVMWWLILCVNLTGLKDAQIAGKTFLGVSVRVFLEEIRIRLSRLNPPSPMWVGIIQSPGGLNESKRQRKGKFSLLELECPSSPVLGHQSSCFSNHWTPGLTSVALWFSGFGDGTELYHWILGSPACRRQIVGLLSLHNHLSQFLS